MCKKRRGADHRVQSRFSFRALFLGEPDPGHPGAEDRGLASADRRENPKGHAGIGRRGGGGLHLWLE